MIERFKRRVFCDLFGLHVGYPEKVGDWMTFYCTRCEKHTQPIEPDRTDAITAQMLRDEGYNEMVEMYEDE